MLKPLLNVFEKPASAAQGSGIDRETYERMVQEENEVWGKLWTDEERLQIIKEEKEAADTLARGKGGLSLKKYLLDNGIECETGLSLGCGEGRAEREFFKKGLCKRIDAIDISEKAIQRAKDLAGEQRLPINYSCVDLNFCQLEKNRYDLVIAQTCLHHIVELEHLAEQIFKSMKPNGLLWVHDYIGESRFQYSELRVKIANSILAALPKELKYSRLKKKYIERVGRGNPDKLCSPFEAIRSAEIIPVFLKRFEILERYENNSILRLVCQKGMKKNYLDHKDGQTIFDFLHSLDRALIDNGILSPAGGQYIMRPRNIETPV